MGSTVAPTIATPETCRKTRRQTSAGTRRGRRQAEKPQRRSTRARLHRGKPVIPRLHALPPFALALGRALHQHWAERIDRLVAGRYLFRGFSPNAPTVGKRVVRHPTGRTELFSIFLRAAAGYTAESFKTSLFLPPVQNNTRIQGRDLGQPQTWHDHGTGLKRFPKWKSDFSFQSTL